MSRSPSPPLRRLPRRPAARELAPLAAVLAVQGWAAWTVWRGPREQGLFLVLLVVVVVAVFAMALGAPNTWLLVVIAVVPLQTVIQARLYTAGVPGRVVTDAGGWKELVLIAGVLAVIGHVRARHAPDALDRLGLALIALAAAYLLLGAWLPGIFPASPSATELLVRSFRTNVAFVVGFLVARRLPWPDRDRIIAVVLAVGTIVALGGIVEYLWNDWWGTIVGDWAGVDVFARDVLGSGGGSVRVALRDGSGGSTIRVGSFIFSPLHAGFYLQVPLALALHRIVRRPDLRHVAIAAACGAAIVMTGTRSAALAAAATVVGVFMALPTRWLQERGRATVLVGASIIAGLVVASLTGVGARFVGVLSGDEPSAAGHRERLVEGVQSLMANPLGLGLGSGPTVAQSDVDGPAVISENAYIQVGNELGVLGLVVFLLLVGALVTELFRRARTPQAEPFDAGMAAAGLGLAVGGLFLHVWTSIPTSLTFWILAGVALRHTREETRP